MAAEGYIAVARRTSLSVTVRPENYVIHLIIARFLVHSIFNVIWFTSIPRSPTVRHVQNKLVKNVTFPCVLNVIIDY